MQKKGKKSFHCGYEIGKISYQIQLLFVDHIRDINAVKDIMDIRLYMQDISN